MSKKSSLKSDDGELVSQQPNPSPQKRPVTNTTVLLRSRVNHPLELKLGDDVLIISPYQKVRVPTDRILGNLPQGLIKIQEVS